MNQQLFNSTNFATSSSRSFFPTEFRAYSGNGTIEFHGNVNWTGPGGGYCMLDFNYHQDASTVNFSYQVSTATVSNTDSYYGNTTKSQEPVYDYRSYTFSFSQSRQSSASGNGYVLGAFNSDGIYGQIINPDNAQKVNDISEPVGLSTDAIILFVGNTKIGSDIAYKMAYTSKLVNGMSYLESLGYIAAGAGLLADFYLSSNTDPKTGEPYQSWGETGLNTAVTLAAFRIGGWWGLGLGVYYYGCKSYIKTIQEHPDWAPQRVSPAFLH